MKKFEYKVEKGDSFNLDVDQAMIDFMSKDGWEFMQALLIQSTGVLRLYFRREIPQTKK